jgi:ABC-type nitrate/sulfonate/bicarbonate transport system substrate-binding protein
MKLVFISIVAASFSRPINGWPADKVHVSHSAISGSQAILWVTHDNDSSRRPTWSRSSSSFPAVRRTLRRWCQAISISRRSQDRRPSLPNLEGADTVVLMSFINTMEHTFITRPDIKKPADLKGKRFGIARPGAADDYGARVAFKKWGLEADKHVAFLAVGSRPSRLAALQAGRVDGVLLQPPFTVKARQEGLNELAFLSDLGLDYLSTCLATTRQTIQRKEGITRRFVRAIMEGVVFYKAHKEASIKSISKFTKLKDRAALEEAYTTYASKFMPRIPYPSIIKGVETILEASAKLIRRQGAPTPGALSSRGLKELEDQGVVAQLYRQ